MKVYQITDDDIVKLINSIDRDPKHGYNGGSATVLTKEEQDAHDKAHRFFFYQISTWLDEIKE